MLLLVSTQSFQEESLKVVALSMSMSEILFPIKVLYVGDAVKPLKNLILLLDVDLMNTIKCIRALKWDIPRFVGYLASLFITML